MDDTLEVTYAEVNLLKLPYTIAQYVDKLGWSMIEAENEMGTQLVAAGVKEKIDTFSQAFWKGKK
jgi:hypothetical protein